MARQTQAVEVTTFVKGLITEASPLTFPDNASLDEDNFNLRRDGSRDRRLGMDFEENYQTVNTGITDLPTGELACSTFSWKNAGGRAEKTLIVIQTGKVVKIFDPDVTPLSAGQVFSVSLPVVQDEQVFSYAIVDGLLVIVTGAKDIQVLEWDGANVARSTATLKIRDLFGVEDNFEGRDLTEGNDISYRPGSLTQQHTYNLRNQTFGKPRSSRRSDDNVRDLIDEFKFPGEPWPSNADNINYALYPDANFEDNRTGDMFHPDDLLKNPPGSFPAPKGFFIIDALERGTGRLEQVNQLAQDSPQIVHPVNVLPEDRTPGGASSIEEYSGRIWYAGFSGNVISGDKKSPRMSSYVLYSQLVRDPTDIGKCYQEGDPTSKENPDLLDTDGGFLRIDGAYNIQRLVNVGEGLMVIAENGIWMVSGGSGYGFSANNNMRKKISENGVQSPGSVVVVDNTLLFWADDAIYHVAPNEFGDWTAKNITQQTIQSFYDDIPAIDKFYAQGAYDSYDRKVRWTYRTRIESIDEVRELILDMTLGSFYTHTISSLGEGILPKVVAPFEVPPFRLFEDEANVTFQGELVTVNGVAVTQEVSRRGAGTRELAYVVLTSTDPVQYTFCLYRDISFKDWVSSDGVGVDAPAYLVTGYLSGGDYLRKKQVPYIKFFFKRTEDGFTEGEGGNLFPNNESSCLVQSQWNWANSANSNRWGRTFQAYRYKRLYMPSGSADNFDNGFEVIETKSKLRGHGTVLSLKMTTEPGKDCRLLGWSMLVGANGNV